MSTFFTLPRIGIALTLSIYLGFGLNHLTHFVTADEHYWIYERIPAYFEAVGDLKWKKTFINDKPGISLALISGIGLLFEPNPASLVTENPDRTVSYNLDHNDRLYFAFRLPILVVNALMLLFLFWVITKLFDEWVALFTVLLTATSPILLGLSQIVNPDALLWSFSSGALFSFLAWLRFRGKGWFGATIGFTAMALLSKYVALLLFPLYALLVMGQFLTNTLSNPEATSQLKKVLLSLGLLFLSTLALVTLFFPALWDKLPLALPFLKGLPWYIQSLPLVGGALLVDIFYRNSFLTWLKQCVKARSLKYIHAILLTLIVLFLFAPILLRYLFPAWDIFTLIPFDIKDLSNARYYTTQPNFFETLILEWLPLSYTLTPVVLVGTLLVGIQAWRKSIVTPLPITLVLLCYPAFFIIVNILLTPRYAVILYPLFALVAAVGLLSAWDTVQNFFTTKLALALLVTLFSLWSLIGIAPFYANYANLLLPKTALISDAWGYGGYEAAQYMNTLPNAKNITVWSDYYGFCEFFIGRCLTAYTFDQNVVQPDYYVLTRRGEIRYRSRADRWERLSGLVAYKYYQAPDPVWKLEMDGRPGNFVKIYQVR